MTTFTVNGVARTVEADLSSTQGSDTQRRQINEADDRPYGERSLVGWGWQPGVGRTPAPGTQKQLGELIQAWVDAGSHCPG